jgi:hypothetical protein
MNWNTIGAEGAVTAAGPQRMAASTRAPEGGSAVSSAWSTPDDASGNRQHDRPLVSVRIMSQLDFTAQHERDLPARVGTGMAPELNSTSRTSSRRATKRDMNLS